MLHFVKFLALLFLAILPHYLPGAEDPSIDPADPFSNGSTIEISGKVTRLTTDGAVVRVTGLKGKKPETPEKPGKREAEAIEKKRQAEEAKKTKRDIENKNPRPATSRGPTSESDYTYLPANRTILIVGLANVAIEDPVKLKLYPTGEIIKGIRCFSTEKSVSRP